MYRMSVILRPQPRRVGSHISCRVYFSLRNISDYFWNKTRAYVGLPRIARMWSVLCENVFSLIIEMPLKVWAFAIFTETKTFEYKKRIMSFNFGLHNCQ